MELIQQTVQRKERHLRTDNLMLDTARDIMARLYRPKQHQDRTGEAKQRQPARAQQHQSGDTQA